MDNIFNKTILPIVNSDGMQFPLPLSSYSKYWKYDLDRKIFRLEGVVYVTKPIRTLTPGTEKTNGIIQTVNIYVPEAYMNKDGSFNFDSTICSATGRKYNVKTAPIIYANSNGGYSEAPSVPLGEYSYYNEWHFGSNEEYLKNGYILVLPGSRGSQTVDAESNKFVGHSPASLVDLKACIRYLRKNADAMPGDIDKIISVGGSGAGAMSALLGASGNCLEYDSYLEEIGAVMTERDDVFAAMCYCPIIDINHSDIAYEWMYGECGGYQRDDGSGRDLTPFEKELSADLSKLFLDYNNGLGLEDSFGNPLCLSGSRSGTYYDYLLDKISKAATAYIRSSTMYYNSGIYREEVIEEYISKLDPDNVGWIKWNCDSGRLMVMSLDGLVKYYCGRSKPCPGFDNLACLEQENDAFGNNEFDRLHFNKALYDVLLKNKEKYESIWTSIDANGLSLKEVLAAFDTDLALSDVACKQHLYNPMEHIVDCTNPKHYRIRVGCLDGHTSFSVAVNFALYLNKFTDSEVDFEFIWDKGHSGPDEDGALCAWIDAICEGV